VRTTGQTDTRQLAIAFRYCFADMLKKYDDGGISNGIMSGIFVELIQTILRGKLARTHRIYADLQCRYDNLCNVKSSRPFLMLSQIARSLHRCFGHPKSRRLHGRQRNANCGKRLPSIATRERERASKRVCVRARECVCVCVCVCVRHVCNQLCNLHSFSD